MCTIIDKQFESQAWQKQIQNINLQTSSVPPLTLTSSLAFFSPEPTLINNYEHQCKHTQTLNLLSLSLHFCNLFPLYPHHPPLMNDFPDGLVHFHTQNLNHYMISVIPHTPLLYLCSHISSIALCDTTVGSEESGQNFS